ncbi:hypothetical protein [Streptomyces halobius]|uniref:Secreted protein n=1 Tax=Streptomyces halobius TaxID=2879846 RepID=A0ABY4MAM8_9ACTN|nr:hypothetical protein [Streptomyces halobius]UQA94397.1 hypothetical protein K9S39_23290 [Streptomyces halobius]
MSEPSRRLIELLLRLLLPARGRHRVVGSLRAPRHEDVPPPHPSHVPVRQPVLLRGEDSPLVRPYVLTREELQERRLRRKRRRVLWLAVHGIDAGPRWIHSVQVVS